MADRPQCQVRYCSKCRLPVRGQVGLTGEKYTQPSSNFLADLLPELQTIQPELEASICQQEEEIANLSAEFSSDLWQGSRILILEISTFPSFRNAYVFLNHVWFKYWNREVKAF